MGYTIFYDKPGSEGVQKVNNPEALYKVVVYLKPAFLRSARMAICVNRLSRRSTLLAACAL